MVRVRCLSRRRFLGVGAGDPFISGASARDGDGAHGTWRMVFGPPVAWTDLTASMPASNEGDNRAVYDPVHNRLVRVSSQMRAYQLSLDAPTGWQEIIVPSSPPPRSFFAAT